MTRRGKLLQKVLDGSCDAGIPFDGMRNLLRWLGFSERIKGSHHFFAISGINEIINLQREGAHCKKYQVKQVREFLTAHRLGGENDPAL